MSPFKKKYVMMYHIKQFTKSMILGTFLFVLCCQNDDNANNHYQSHTTLTSDNTKQLITVKAETIPHILDFIAHEQKGFLPQLEPHTRHLDTNNPFGTIDTSIIKALEDLQGNRVYTFKIIPFTPSNGIFYNLIVVTDYDANIIKSYIKSYESFENKKIGADFNGKVSKYSLDGTLVNDIVFHQGKANGPDCTPCEDVTDDTDTNNHGGSTSGDPDDTTNDPTDTDTDSTSSTSGGGGSSSASSGPGSASSNSSNTSNSGTGGENISITIIPCPCAGHSLEEACTCDTPPTIIINIGAAQNHKNAASAIPLPCCEEDIAVIEEEDTPCDNLKRTTILNLGVRDRLKQLLTSGVNDREEFFKIRKNPDTNLDTPTPIGSTPGDCTAAKIRYHGNTFAAAHSHPQGEAGCNAFRMFSGEDILQLAQMAANYQGLGHNNYTSYTFILTINTPNSGSFAYAIKFGNQEAINTLQNLYNDSEKRLNFSENFEKKYQSLADQPGETASHIELMEVLFNILEDYNLNIELYKATKDNSNFVTNWNKINKETLQQEPCE